MATIDLVVPNMAEYFLRNPALTLTGEERERVIRFGGTYECEHSVVWSSSDRVLLLPEGYDATWFADMHRAVGYAEPPVVSPRSGTGLLVEDLLRDGAAQRRLRAVIEAFDTVRVLMFGPTPAIYRLQAMLTGWGAVVELDSVPEEDYWVSVYLDSKISVTDLARRMPQLNVANGFTVSSWDELRGALTALVEQDGSAIVRSLHGVAGDGSSVVRAGQSVQEAVDAFVSAASRDSFFVFPLLVQEFIEHADGVGCPAADILVGADGVEEVVPCSLTVEDGHLFRSVDVGPDALPPVWAQRLVRLAREVGEAARELGYRGWMCIDCVAGTDDRLHVTEINARRSGSIHAGALLRHWGRETQLTVSAHFMVAVPVGASYVKDIRPVFEELWAEGVRAYPTTIRGIHWPEPIMAVLVAARSAAAARDVVDRIVDRVGPSSAPLRAFDPVPAPVVEPLAAHATTPDLAGRAAG